MDKTTEERTPEELAWIGLALSICMISEDKRTSSVKLVHNCDEGLADALKRRIGGSVRTYSSKESGNSYRWSYEDKDEITALIKASWPWLTETTQKRARKLEAIEPVA